MLFGGGPCFCARNLPHPVARGSADLGDDTGNVFADDPDAHKDHPAEESHGENERGIAGFRDLADPPADENDETESESDEGGDETKKAEEAQRHR